MPKKIITLDEHFHTGEPTVQLVSTWGRAGRLLREDTSLHKIASTDSPALDYIKTVEPEPGKSIVLIVGLGDHETYGANRNGDSFPSEPVPGKVNKGETLKDHYKSYEKAHVFKHHVNNDPAKAIGKVKKAFWNPKMHRVEVLEDFDHKLAPELLEKVASGVPMAKSMGCRIKYDVCTICGNKAKTRKDYCDHLKYEMSKIYPDGKIAAALNPSPDFFDSSWVVRPADRTGYMLKKVARDRPYEIRTASFDLGEITDALASKAAAAAKAAEIEKLISGDPVASASNLSETDGLILRKFRDAQTGDKMPELSNKQMRIVIEYTPAQVEGTANATGMPLGLEELIRYFFGRLSGGEMLPPECSCAATKHAAAAYRVFSEYPRLLEDMSGLLKTASPREYREKLARNFLQWQRDKHFGESEFHEEARPRTDLLRVGNKYTTVGAARNVEDQLKSHDLKKKMLTSVPLIGAGALLGAATYGKPLGMLGAAGLIGTGLYQGLKGSSHPTVQAHDGTPISAYTDMVQKTAEFAPELRHIYIRTKEASVGTLDVMKEQAILRELNALEEYDEEATTLGPKVDFNKVSALFGQSILDEL